MKGLLSSLLSGLLTGTAAFSVDENLGSIVIAFVSTVGITLAVINWIDKRIDSKIRPLTKKLDELQHLLTNKRKSDNERFGENARTPRGSNYPPAE